MQLPKREMPKTMQAVPKDKVGEVVQSFLDNDGVKHLQVEQQPDGSFTVTPKRNATLGHSWQRIRSK